MMLLCLCRLEIWCVGAFSDRMRKPVRVVVVVVVAVGVVVVRFHCLEAKAACGLQSHCPHHPQQYLSRYPEVTPVAWGSGCHPQ